MFLTFNQKGRFMNIKKMILVVGLCALNGAVVCQEQAQSMVQPEVQAQPEQIKQEPAVEVAWDDALCADMLNRAKSEELYEATINELGMFRETVDATRLADWYGTNNEQTTRLKLSNSIKQAFGLFGDARKEKGQMFVAEYSKSLFGTDESESLLGALAAVVAQQQAQEKNQEVAPVDQPELLQEVVQQEELAPKVEELV